MYSYKILNKLSCNEICLVRISFHGFRQASLLYRAYTFLEGVSVLDARLLLIMHEFDCRENPRVNSRLRSKKGDLIDSCKILKDLICFSQRFYHKIFSQSQRKIQTEELRVISHKDF
jgi:hypothetical protein